MLAASRIIGLARRFSALRPGGSPPKGLFAGRSAAPPQTSAPAPAEEPRAPAPENSGGAAPSQDAPADRQQVARSLLLMKLSPNEQTAMNLFRDMLRSHSSRENLATAASMFDIVCSSPDCLRSPLVPIYMLEQAIFKHFPLTAHHAKVLAEQTMRIWPAATSYRSYFRMLAQQLSVLESLQSLKLLSGHSLTHDFIQSNVAAIGSQVSSPLLESQVQVLRSLLVLDAQRAVDPGLRLRLLAHIHSRLDFLDFADLLGLLDSLRLASSAGADEELAARLESCVGALADRLRRRPPVASQASFLAVLRLSNQLEAAPERLRPALQPLLRGKHLEAVPEAEASGYAGFFGAVRDDLALDGLGGQAKAAFASLLSEMTQHSGIGWYKQLAPVIQVVLWKRIRLGVASAVAAPDLKTELLCLVESCDSRWVRTPHGQLEAQVLSPAIAASIKKQTPLDLSALVASKLRPLD